MILPKELSSKPKINVTFVINGNNSQVFFDFDKDLQMKTQKEVDEFFLENKIQQLTNEFLQVLKAFLRKLED